MSDAFTPNPHVGDAFRSYVHSNTRGAAIAKRCLLVHALNEEVHMSVRSVVQAIGGNSLDQQWVSQAIKDGWIGRGADGTLRMGRPALVVHTAEELAAEFVAGYEAASNDGEDLPPDALRVAYVALGAFLRGEGDDVQELLSIVFPPARAARPAAYDRHGQPLPEPTWDSCKECGTPWHPGQLPKAKKKGCSRCAARRASIAEHYDLDNPRLADHGAYEEGDEDQ